MAGQGTIALEMLGEVARPRPDRRADRRRRADLGHRHRRQGAQARHRDRRRRGGPLSVASATPSAARTGRSAARRWRRASRSRPSGSCRCPSCAISSPRSSSVEEAADRARGQRLCHLCSGPWPKARARRGSRPCCANPERFQGKRVGLVLCGGNIDARILASVMVRELERDDRIASFRITSNDRPGLLGRVASRLGETRRQHPGGFPRPVVPRRAGQRRFHRHHYRNARQTNIHWRCSRPSRLTDLDPQRIDSRGLSENRLSESDGEDMANGPIARSRELDPIRSDAHLTRGVISRRFWAYLVDLVVIIASGSCIASHRASSSSASSPSASAGACSPSCRSPPSSTTP